VTFSLNGTNAAKQTTAGFQAAGTYTFRVTARDGSGATATSTVVVQVLQTVTTMTLPPGVEVGLHGTATFEPTVYDQFGALIVNPPPLTWAVSGGGTIADGTFTAGGSPGGPYTVRVTDPATGTTGTTTVTVVDLPPIVVVPPTAEVPLGAPLRLVTLGDDDGGEPALRYTWTVTGPGEVVFTINGTNDAKNVFAIIRIPGRYTFTITVTDAAGQTATATGTVDVVEVVTDDDVTDHAMYVKSGRFAVQWKRHARGKAADRLKLVGFINPAGLRANLAGTEMALTLGDTEVVGGPLDARGRYRTPKGATPKLRFAVSARTGKFRLGIGAADLRDLFGVAPESGAGIMTIPVGIHLSTADTTDFGNRCEFQYRTVANVRTSGRFRARRERLLDGTFMAVRTKVRYSKRKDGYVVRTSGFINPTEGRIVSPRGDLVVTLGSTSTVVPLVDLGRSGADERRSRWKYRSRTAAISLLTLHNGSQRFKMKTQALADTDLMLAADDDAGRTADLPLTVEIPLADGMSRFTTIVELVRPHTGTTSWSRPGQVP
jgi:hypothetical protein